MEHLTPKDAIDQLFDAYSDDVYRFALHSIGNQNDAKDIVQEVFLRAYQGWNNFRHNSSVKTWLFHIARNYICDFFRRKRVRTDNVTDFDLNQAGLSESPDTSIDLRNAILQLKLNYRQVIALRFIEDLSAEEIARILGWTSSKVRTTQHRALKQLRDILGGHVVESLNAYQEDGGIWEILDQKHDIIASGNLFGQFKGDKIYQTTFALDHWEANRNYVVLQLNEIVQGWTQPVRLDLFVVKTNEMNQLPKPLVNGNQWGGEQFTWHLSKLTVHAVQKSLNKQGNVITVFDRNFQL